MSFTRRDTSLPFGSGWDVKDPALLWQLKGRFGFRVVLDCSDQIPLLPPALTLATTCERYPADLGVKEA